MFGGASTWTFQCSSCLDSILHIPPKQPRQGQKGTTLEAPDTGLVGTRRLGSDLKPPPTRNEGDVIAIAFKGDDVSHDSYGDLLGVNMSSWGSDMSVIIYIGPTVDNLEPSSSGVRRISARIQTEYRRTVLRILLAGRLLKNTKM